MRKNQQGLEKCITQEQILKKHHKFLRQSSSDSDSDYKKSDRRSRDKKKDIYQNYGERMAKKYYEKLYKEYALVDLSRFQTGQIGCRWRTQKQVLREKGEKMCGSIQCSDQSKEVFEMNFGYIQEGIKKNALVKVSLCLDCGKKLNFKKSHKKLENQATVELKREEKKQLIRNS